MQKKLSIVALVTALCAGFAAPVRSEGRQNVSARYARNSFVEPAPISKFKNLIDYNDNARISQPPPGGVRQFRNDGMRMILPGKSLSRPIVGLHDRLTIRGVVARQQIGKFVAAVGAKKLGAKIAGGEQTIQTSFYRLKPGRVAKELTYLDWKVRSSSQALTFGYTTEVAVKDGKARALSTEQKWAEYRPVLGGISFEDVSVTRWDFNKDLVTTTRKYDYPTFELAIDSRPIQRVRQVDRSGTILSENDWQ